jgi:hypothetical protein
VGISNKASPQTILFTWNVPACRGIEKAYRTSLLVSDCLALEADAPGFRLAMYLVIAARDPYAVTTGDPQRSKQQRCIAHLVLAAAFLSAMATLGQGEA